ncbi:expressed unknown protein [Seminavis robusta]|uniref:DUF6824 domain-containing protein n=1 Tax=Seminavis robusta TaxID=568900 RepID=A0A9N8HSB3_9STRA|nr:expressed unknown protein [Seminavis robusta]|eukprot:Sro1695_g291800.1 n/a (284) ;mRNA; r:17350-18305
MLRAKRGGTSVITPTSDHTNHIMSCGRSFLLMDRPKLLFSSSCSHNINPHQKNQLSQPSPTDETNIPVGTMSSKPDPQWIRFGKGSGSNHHPGNKRYVALIRDNQIPYLLLRTNDDKNLFIKRIQTQLCEAEQRKFVEKNHRGIWEEASYQRIREKIRTALCDSKLKNALKIDGVYWPKDDEEVGVVEDVGAHGVEELIQSFDFYESFGKEAARIEGTQFIPLFVEEGESDDDDSILGGGSTGPAIMTKGSEEMPKKKRAVTPEHNNPRKRCRMCRLPLNECH